MSYKFIKELVFDIIHRTNGRVEYDGITKLVMKYFPESKWKESHWVWYKNQIRGGKFKDEFSNEEKKNLKLNRGLMIKSGVYAENEVKRIGDSILNQVRDMIREVVKGDENFEFKLNRWIYARLMADERKKKTPIKLELWSMGISSCQDCNKEFNTIKGIEIHRIDSSKAYSIDNCQLLCRSCHQKKDKRIIDC